jgi:hypothetical protein
LGMPCATSSSLMAARAATGARAPASKSTWSRCSPRLPQRGASAVSSPDIAEKAARHCVVQAQALRPAERRTLLWRGLRARAYAKGSPGLGPGGAEGKVLQALRPCSVRQWRRGFDQRTRKRYTCSLIQDPTSLSCAQSPFMSPHTSRTQ